MNCIQAASFIPVVKVETVSPAFVQLSLRHVRGTLQVSTTYPKLSVSRYQRCQHICWANGKDKSGDGEQGFVWDNQSLEDRLRKQIQEQKLDDDGGGDGDGGRGGHRPRGGGPGGGSGGPLDEGLRAKLDELLQVLLATGAVLCWYVYILEESGPIKTVRDYFIYRFGGRKSVRLKLAMSAWRRFTGRIERYSRSQEVGRSQEVSLEELKRALTKTKTNWDRFGMSRILQ